MKFAPGGLSICLMDPNKGLIRVKSRPDPIPLTPFHSLILCTLCHGNRPEIIATLSPDGWLHNQASQFQIYLEHSLAVGFRLR